jgi:cell division protein ZapA
MAQVTVEINGKPYTVGCEDGQEGHLRELASLFDRQVRLVAEEVGPIGDTRLMLMGALLLSDELSDARARLAHAQADLSRVQSDYARAESRAVTALESAAKRIEKLAGT